MAGGEWVVVGLGNPGREYADTRHNMGYWTVEDLAQRVGAAWRIYPLVEVAHGLVQGRPVCLAKPRRWMNLSGEAVAWCLQTWQIPLCRLVVVCDDVALPDGTVRIRQGGSSGGHKGLASVIAAVGSGDFVRVRVGVGSHRKPDEDLSEFVLRPLAPREGDLLREAVALAASEIQRRIAQGAFEATTLVVSPRGGHAPARETHVPATGEEEG